MRFFHFFSAACALLLSANSSWSQTYEIRYVNRSNQTLTSPVCAVHSAASDMFVPGQKASEGLAALAEDGVNGTFAQEARSVRGVSATTAVGEFVSNDETGVVRISSRRGSLLSCIFGMLVATNDGFAAARNVRLPKRVGQSRAIRGVVYDSGSEVNTESCEHIPGGPCNAHFVGLEENGTVQLHSGISGQGDLNRGQLQWPEVAVRATVTRVR
jgi:hypothetical protein